MESKSLNEYAVSLNAGSIKTADDVLALAQGLENGAKNAYLGVIPSFKNNDFKLVCAKLAVDETRHASIIAFVRGDLGYATKSVFS